MPYLSSTEGIAHGSRRRQAVLTSPRLKGARPDGVRLDSTDPEDCLIGHRRAFRCLLWAQGRPLFLLCRDACLVGGGTERACLHRCSIDASDIWPSMARRPLRYPNPGPQAAAAYRLKPVPCAGTVDETIPPRPSAEGTSKHHPRAALQRRPSEIAAPAAVLFDLFVWIRN